MNKKHYVYILKCSDNTYYTGYTSNLQNRLYTHNSGKGAKYTRGRLPVRIAWSKLCKNQKFAMHTEINIKAFPKEAKEKLIGGTNIYSLYSKYGRKVKSSLSKK